MPDMLKFKKQEKFYGRKEVFTIYCATNSQRTIR